MEGCNPLLKWRRPLDEPLHLPIFAKTFVAYPRQQDLEQHWGHFVHEGQKDKDLHKKHL